MSDEKQIFTPPSLPPTAESDILLYSANGGARVLGSTLKQAHLKHHHVKVVKVAMMTAVTPKMRSLSTLVLRACEERCEG